MLNDTKQRTNGWRDLICGHRMKYVAAMNGRPCGEFADAIAAPHVTVVHR